MMHSNVCYISFDSITRISPVKMDCDVYCRSERAALMRFYLYKFRQFETQLLITKILILHLLTSVLVIYI